MKILMLSWRCPRNPRAGGAEILTAQLLRHLADVGHEVTWFSAAFPGAPAEETVDGIRHVRRGRQWTVHLHAWRWLRRRSAGFDRVVDQINTIPFFTPLYVHAARRRFLIHQLAREYWWRETRGLFRAIAPVGYAAEPLYLRAYRGTRGITISESTRDDLARLGIARESVGILPLGPACPVAERLVEKPQPFSIVMLGRLTPAKFVEEGVQAFSAVRGAVADARLDIAGAGDERYRARLEALVSRLDLADAVTFHGRVDGDRRQELLAAAHVHLFASHREGWGLVVSEAAAAGTPSVGYDAPGVRDSIADPSLLAPIGDVRALAERIIGLRRDPDRYAAVREQAWRRAIAGRPERTVSSFEAMLA